MAFGEIPDFSKKIATIRSRSVQATVLFQSMSALKERYPHDAHLGILGNTDVSVFLGTTDPGTAEFVSARGGETSVLVESEMESHNKFDITRFSSEYRQSQGVGKRMILTPDEILTMGKDNRLREIIIMKDQPILLCEKFDYTRDPESKKWEPFSMNDFNPRDAFWFDEGLMEQRDRSDYEEQDGWSTPEPEGAVTPDTLSPPPDPEEPKATKEPKAETRPKPKNKPEEPPAQDDAPSEKREPSLPMQRRSKPKKPKEGAAAPAPENQLIFPGFSGDAVEKPVQSLLPPGGKGSAASKPTSNAEERWPRSGETGYQGSGIEL